MVDFKMIDSAFKVSKDFVKQYHSDFGFIPQNEVEINHISDIIAGLLGVKYKFGYPGGHFVNSVINNDLLSAVMYADSIVKRAISLVVAGVNNISLEDIKKS